MQPIRSPLRVARFELFISLLKVQSTIDWLKIVQFTGIPHISLVILGDSAERVLRTIVDIVPLPILETIDVPGTAEIIHFLAANPLYTSQIRFLVLRLPESYTERELRVQANPSFGSINMPFLHHYHGPFHLLAMFKPDRVLRTLISSDRRTLYDDTQVFASLTKCTDLEVLCIRVYRVTQGFLETICSRYSHLKKLSVQYDCIKQGDGDIDGHASFTFLVSGLLLILSASRD